MTPRIARHVLLAATILGVAGNWLLRETEWRAGFVVWLLAVLAAAFIAVERAGASAEPSVRREGRMLFGAGVLLALAVVLRDADLLFVVNMFAVVVLSAVIAWRANGRSLTRLEPRDAILGVAASLGTVVGGAPTLALRDAAPQTMTGERRRSLGAFGVGAVIAMPVLLAVALLLGSADPLFAAFLEETGALLDGRLVGHLVGIGAVAWVAAGAMRGTLTPISGRLASFDMRPQLTFPAVAPLLGGLALLLSMWIGLQVRSMFGGAEYIASTVGVTVAEYARRGFFELVVIAGIVLAALLAADDLLERTAGSTRRSFRAVASVLLGLVAAVLVSALLRLGVYLRFYGLTEDRVLAVAVLAWVALVLGWFGFTVLRDARQRFAPGVLVLSALWLGGLNVANPERWIVETNVRRAAQGLSFDVAYHAGLSGDALPALLGGVDRLAPAEAAALRTEIARVWQQREVSRRDWRGWTLPYVLGVRRALTPEAVRTLLAAPTAAAPAAALPPSGSPPPTPSATDAAR